MPRPLPIFVALALVPALVIAAAPVALAQAVTVNDITAQSDVRTIDLRFVGGSLDAKRAAAVAGSAVIRVPHVGFPDNRVIERELKRGEELVDIYVDAGGTFWVFFEVEPDDAPRMDGLM